MTTNNLSTESPIRPSSLLGIAFLIAAVSAWLALFALLRVPSDPQNARFLGYSLERLVLVALMLLPSLGLSTLALRARSNRLWLTQFSAQLEGFASRPLLFNFLWISSVLIFLLSWMFYFLPIDRAISIYGSSALYLPRLQPLLIFSLVASFLLLLIALVHHFALDTSDWPKVKPTLRLSVILFSAFLLLWALIALTRLGLGFDLTKWNAPGAPLLASQIFLALLFAFGLSLLLFFFRRNLKGQWIDIALFILIWFLAALIWLSSPAAPNHYSSATLPPNNESYPLSDAFNHDVIANNLLIGEGFRFNDLRAVRKPLYAAFLAGLHSVAGSNYGDLINLQVIVLALFPALLFLLARVMHSRFAGLILAALATLREANAIRLGGVINLSHAKLLMADLPAALGLVFLTLLAVVFLRRFPSRPQSALLVGATLGFLLLLRSQQLSIIPALLLLFYLALRSFYRSGLLIWRQLFFFLLGVSLASGPWLLRNHALTGQWVIEQSTAASFLAQRYSEDPQNVEVAFLPGESEGAYYARHMSQVSSFIVEHPAESAAFVADNYLRNLYLTLMPLPLSLQLRDPESHVRQLPYWPSWNGDLLPESYLPLTASLFLIALGISIAWQRLGWAGLAPLAINFGFTLNLAVARVSGWRYNQPVDWSLILYYAFGLAQLILWIFALIGQKGRLAVEDTAPAGASPKQDQAVSWRKLGLSILLVLLLGTSPILWEQLSSPRYSAPSQEQAMVLLRDPSIANQASRGLEDLLATGKLGLVSGRALYPRFLAAGQGNPDSSFALTLPEDYSRITFFLLGPVPSSITLPYELDPTDLHSGADVFVFTCSNLRARVAAVLVFENQYQPSQLLISSPESLCDS